MSEPAKSNPAGPSASSAPGSTAKSAAKAKAPEAPAAKPSGGVPWKTIWPLPALVVGAGLFGAGIYTAFVNRPKPDPGVPIRKAEALVEARKFPEAIEVLNTDVKAFLDKGEEAGVTRDHRAAYHLAMARAFSGAQEQLGFSREENHQTVVRQYQKAEELGVHIRGADVTRMVEALVALGRLEDALKRVRELPMVGGAAQPSATAGPTTKGHENHDAHAEGGDGGAHEVASAEGGPKHEPDSHGAAGEAHVPGPESDGLSESQRRVRLTKLVVEANLASAHPRDDLTLELLAELGGMPNLSPDDRSWVLARQAELLIAAGRPEDAIVKLLPRIRLQPRGETSSETDGELYLLLGRAYFDAGQFDAATRQLEAADRLLSPSSDKRAQSDLILGRIFQTTGNLEAAKEHFATVVTSFSTTPSYLPALLGMAEVEGAVGGSGEGDDASRELESSIRHYAEIVDTLKNTPDRREISKPRVASSLMERHRDRYQAGDLGSALRFAQLAESMFPDSEVPGEVHMALAQTHRRLADETLSAARDKGGPDFTITDLNPVERTEIKQNYLSAADHFLAYSALVAAIDNRGYSDALWAAGDSFDLAGDLEQAKRTFSTYAQGASDDDPRRPEARFRLAQIFQAQGDYASAESLYKSLRETKGVGSPRRQGGSFWGDQAIVPLARCFLADNQSENDDEAEQLLLSVVDGSVVAPDAPEFREALIELGRMYYYQGGGPVSGEAGTGTPAAGAGPETAPQASRPVNEGESGGKFAKAIARLSEAVRRYPNDRRRDELRYWLADAQRLSAAQIAGDLKQSLPQSTRQELEKTRSDRLRRAMAGYEDVRDALEQKPEGKRSELERTYLRNAWFYIGDCAFDLGDYDAAVNSYDAARQRYANDPASLVAMVQIVNAYVAQDRWAEARTANERAVQHLARFPESVWNRPDLPMERRHWERWLEARTLLDQSASAEEAPRKSGENAH